MNTPATQNKMDESNLQENNEMNNDNDTNEQNYDIMDEEDNDEEDERVYLNNETFERLKQNDPTITNLYVQYGGGSFFNSIDWKKDGGCIANNTQLKSLVIYYVGNMHKQKYTLGEEGQYDIYQLPTRQQLKHFFSCVYTNHSIGMFSVSNIHIDDKFSGGLIEGLHSHPSLLRLEFIEFCSLGIIGCNSLGKVLKQPKSKLKDLRLINCHIDDEGLCAVCDGLAGNTALKKLCLKSIEKGNEHITSVGWRALATVLQSTDSQLVNLQLDNNGIDDEGLDILGSALRGSSVKILNLGYNRKISSEGWQTLLNQLSQTSLEYLDLNNNNIDGAGLAALVNIGTLLSLNLSGSRSVTSPGWWTFFNLLQRIGARLVKLDISNNKVGGVSMATLGSLLSNMITLKELNISDMENVCPQGWQVLFTTLRHNSNLNLRKLHLYGNKIDDQGMQLLVQLLSNMTSLKDLRLNRHYSVPPTGWQALTGYLRSPRFALEELRLNDYRMNDDTLIAFANALANNKTLKLLYVYEDPDDENDLITMRGMKAVSSLLCNKTSIMDTYNSNHTLRDMSEDDVDDALVLPDDLVSYLILNENKDKVEVARQKILQTHFSSDEDDNSSKMQEFLDMELEMMPTAISWIGRPTHADWKGTNVSGLSLMFNLLRRVPDLFDSSPQTQKKQAGTKRKSR